MNTESCLGDSTQCGTTCVSLQSDQRNCGACGNACSNSQVCTAGVCEQASASCNPGLSACSGSCVDVQRDTNNCGACGQACTSGQACVSGQCVAAAPSCTGGSTMCGASCVDTQHDPMHCGACGAQCGATEFCAQGTCRVTLWEILADTPTSNPNLVGYAPSGQSRLFAVDENSLRVFHFPTATGATGQWEEFAALPVSVGNYATPAWDGANKVYVFGGRSLFLYHVSDNSWSTPIDGALAYATADTQATVDSEGFVYGMAQQGQLIRYDGTLGATGSSGQPISGLTYIPLPTGIATYWGGTSQNRVAWDPSIDTIYLGAYGNEPFWTYSLMTQTFEERAPFPDPSGMSDAFCTDRAGHLVTANDGGDYSSVIWMYTHATNTWRNIASAPFAHGSSASCALSSDGYVYWSDGEDNNFARLKLF